MTQPPINWRRHQVLVPHTLPKPMPEDNLLRLFRVIDRLRDRAMFLLMLRCGLRVGEVSTLTWPAINVGAGSIRINNGKGQVDRVVYYSADVAQALRHWRRWQPLEATDLFPSALQPGRPLGVRAIQHCMARYLDAAGISNPYSPHSLQQSLCYSTAQCRGPVGGGERTHGPSVHQYDAPLHATLRDHHTPAV
ncbi:MAG TPA: tyrosine-type recombinase/integrase [Candidatus Tectomicrobia bacterium]